MAAPKSKTAESTSPQRWWQWFLLYPALGVSLITALPQWVDKIQAWRHNLQQESYKEAMRENELWRQNLTCVGAPYAWYTNPKEVKVDATICNSGDVFVRASAPGGREVIKWMALDDIVGQKKAQLSLGLIPAAKARSADDRPSIGRIEDFADPAASQYQNVYVVCQRFLDQRRLLRHVRVNNGCFDEIFDTFNGTMLQRSPVPCRPGC